MILVGLLVVKVLMLVGALLAGDWDYRRVTEGDMLRALGILVGIPLHALFAVLAYKGRALVATGVIAFLEGVGVTGLGLLALITLLTSGYDRDATMAAWVVALTVVNLAIGIVVMAKKA